jgi:hypothetical protein
MQIARGAVAGDAVAEPTTSMSALAFITTRRKRVGMQDSESLPEGWTAVTDRTEHQSFIDREYTTITFEHRETGRRVYVNDVQEPNSFGGWGYLVRADGRDHGELGLVEDLESARELAVEFMRTYEPQAP